MIGANVLTLCFAMFALFLEFRARARRQGLRPFFRLRNRAEVSHVSPRKNCFGRVTGPALSTRPMEGALIALY